MNHLTIAFKKVGGAQVVAEVCGKSVRAVYKWLDKGKLPRTEYTGETTYAQKISALPNADFTADELLHPESSSEAA
tara:strand:- start:5289 stop:5516 length:228 start_codon:yes stop_codon:yes gene_type:complete